MSDIEFFGRTSAIAHAYFLAQVDGFAFCRSVGVDEMFFSVVVAREFPRLCEIGVRELDSSVKRELSF